MSELRKASVLVAGIGNVFLGDDGFGVEVVRRLAQRPLGAHVRLMDAGIRGLDLAYALLDGWDAAVLIDAVRWGNAPGTLYVIEPETEPQAGAEASEEGGAGLVIESHGMDPASVLRFVQAQGGTLPRLRLVGCEPGPSGEEFAVGLSEPVLGALEEAVQLVEQVIAELVEVRGA